MSSGIDWKTHIIQPNQIEAIQKLVLLVMEGASINMGYTEEPAKHLRQTLVRKIKQFPFNFCYKINIDKLCWSYLYHTLSCPRETSTSLTLAVPTREACTVD